MKKIILVVFSVVLMASCRVMDPFTEQCEGTARGIVSMIEQSSSDTVECTVSLDTNSIMALKPYFKKEGYLLQKKGDTFSLLKKETKTRYAIKFAPVNPDYYFVGTSKIILHR